MKNLVRRAVIGRTSLNLSKLVGVGIEIGIEK